MREAALRLEETAHRSNSPESFRALGVARLADDETDAAVEAFQAAITLDPADAASHIDLSAALVNRWRRRAQPLDLVTALDEAETARQSAPAATQALFNEAVVFDALGLAGSARNAWMTYVREDARGSWFIEAQDRLRVLAVDSRPAPSLERLRTASKQTIADAVAADPFAVYGYLEGNLLPRWATAPELNGPVLQFASALCDALQQQGRDRYLRQLVLAAADSPRWSRVRRDALARGVAGIFRWRDLIDAGDYAGADSLASVTLNSLNQARVDDAEAQVERAYSDLVAGRTRQALARLDIVEPRALHEGVWRIVARSKRLRALAATEDARIADAQALYTEGLGLAKRAGDIELAGLFDSFLAEGYELLGERLTSWRHLGSALSQMPRFRTMRQRYDTLSDAAIAARGAGLDHAAKRFSDELLVSTAAWPNPEGQITAHLERARALSDLGQGDRGMADIASASALLPKLATRPQAQARLSAEVDAFRAYSLASTADEGALEAASRAIDFFERGYRMRLAGLLLQRGRLYKRLDRSRDAIRDWRAGVAILEDQRPAVRDEQLRVSRTADLWGLFEELIDAAKSDPLEAASIAERAHARELLDSLARDQPPGIVNLATVQTMLPDGVQALMFAQLSNRLMIWRVDRSTITSYERAIPAATVRGLVRRAEMPAGEDSRSALETLGSLLLPEDLSLSSTRTLVLVPDDALYRVPFAALVVPRTLRRLVEVTVPVVAPSLTTFVLASRQLHPAAAPDVRVLVIAVGTPVPSLELPMLPAVAEEGTRVFSMYTQGDVLRDSDATKEAVSALVPAAGVLHFAGHAEIDEQYPSRSRLLVAGGAGLSPADIARLKLRPGAVAVLGACDTAVGTVFRGEGPMSLVRSFLAAGASAVVASLWKIRDEDASALLVRLHEQLRDGNNAADSLAAAQRLMIREGRPLSAWAAYVTIGGTVFDRRRPHV